MSSDEDFILEDEGRKNKIPASDPSNKDGEHSENKVDAGTQSLLPQKRKAEEANVVEEGKQAAASPGINDDDSCSIAIQTAPPRLKKKRKKQLPTTELKTTVVQAHTVGTVVHQTTLPRTAQVNQQNITHIPAGLQLVKESRPIDLAAKTSASVNTNVVVGNTVSLAGTLPSTSTTQADRNTSSVPRVHLKLPVTLNASTSSTVAKPSSSAALPTSQVRSVTSAQAVAVSKNLSSTAVTIASQHLQSQARLSTAVPGLGKVMLVSSSGVPLQIVKAVSQPLIQGKTLNTSLLTTQGNTRLPVCVVSSSSSLSNPVGKTTLASSSLLAQSTASQLPSSTSAKQASHVSTTSATPLHPPVFLVQRPGSGGVVPLAVKGGAIVMPSSSASQQVVLIRPSSSLTSSTTSATTLLSGAGISVLGSTQIAQTALGHKVILSPGVLSASKSLPQLGPKTKLVTGNKPVVQVAQAPSGIKPSDPKTTSLALGNKPLIVMTTASPSIITANKAATSTCVTVGSKSAALITSPSDSKHTCTASAVGNQQVLGTVPVASSEIRAPNKQLTNVGSDRACGTEVSKTVATTLTSNCNTVKGADIQTVSTVLPDTRTVTAVLRDTQTVSAVLPDTRTVSAVSSDTQTMSTALPDTRTVSAVLPDTRTVSTISPDAQTVSTVLPEKTNVKCDNKSFPSNTITTNRNSQPENIDDNFDNKGSTELHEREKDTKNGSDPLVDLTCYETSVSDSTGCEESDDSAPNGLHPDLKASLPSKLAETDVKLCNGVSRLVTPDTKCDKQELDSVEWSHAVTKQTTNGVVINET